MKFKILFITLIVIFIAFIFIGITISNKYLISIGAIGFFALSIIGIPFNDKKVEEKEEIRQ
ncbi:MAG: hypothetical protein K6G28_06735 [Acholeplasmatales bacterium]|nr:hypothetical protein [Acholeplasmatales bacterium]